MKQTSQIRDKRLLLMLLEGKDSDNDDDLMKQVGVDMGWWDSSVIERV